MIHMNKKTDWGIGTQGPGEKQILYLCSVNPEILGLFPSFRDKIP